MKQGKKSVVKEKEAVEEKHFSPVDGYEVHPGYPKDVVRRRCEILDNKKGAC